MPSRRARPTSSPAWGSKSSPPPLPGFDSAKQMADVETTLALDPDIILSLPLDPVASAAAFKKASEAGVKLVFLSNLPADYKHPADYAAIVTDDLFQMGKQAADALAASMGGKGKVGWIFHDAAYYVTNQRDNAFKTTIQNDYPDMQIVAEAGISDPARAEEIANAMLLQNPDLGGIYVTWAGPAEGVLARFAANGNTTTKIVTLDLSEPIALDMVKGGNVAASSPMRPMSWAVPWPPSAPALCWGSKTRPLSLPRTGRDQGQCRRRLAEIAAQGRAAVRA